MQVPELSEGDAEFEETQVVDREERMPALVAVPAGQALDRVVIGHQSGDLGVGDPRQQRLVPGIEIAAQRVDLDRIGFPVPLEDLGGEPGVEQEDVAGLAERVALRMGLAPSRAPGSTTTSSALMISSSVARSTPRQSFPR